MPRLDVSLLARVRFTSIPIGELHTDFVVISHTADGAARYAFVETNRRPSLRGGLGAAFWEDGTLRHFGFYEAGACVSSIDLHPPSEHGVFRQGRKMRTGEIYDRGTTETLSPWSDGDTAQPTAQSYEDWVVEHVAAVMSAANA